MASRVIALLVAAVALCMIPAVADAGHRRNHYRPGQEYNVRGWSNEYRPYYHRHYRSDWEYDRYAYGYAPRSYYPYYNSGHWVPRQAMRYRYRYTYYGPQYRYYRAWGYGLSEPRCCARGWR